jgi:hypothetical protein
MLKATEQTKAEEKGFNAAVAEELQKGEREREIERGELAERHYSAAVRYRLIHLSLHRSRVRKSRKEESR